MSSDPERDLCQVCINAPRTTKFRPCGHHIACEPCATELRRSGPCPICQVPIDGWDTAHQMDTMGRQRPTAASAVPPCFERITSSELRKLSTFHWNDHIGQGAFGVVYRGMFQGQPVAIKCVPRNATAADRAGILSEVATLGALKHTYLIAPLAYCGDSGDEAIVFPLYESLDEELLRALPLSAIERIIADVASALAYLHSERRVHRDMKPQNILMQRERGEVVRALLCDVGILRAVDGTHRTTVQGGTDGFIDPDVQRTGQCHLSNDVYSFGVTMACLFGRQVRPTELTGTLSLQEFIHQRVPERYKVLVTKMVGEARARPTAALVAAACHGGPEILAVLAPAGATTGLPPNHVQTTGPMLDLTDELWTQRRAPDFAARLMNRPVAVHLKGSDVTQTDVDRILSSMHLMALDLTDCSGVTSIVSIDCRKLTTLILNGTGVGQAGIGEVEAPLLQSLDLNGCYGITDVSTLLRGCRTLTALDVRGTEITQAGIAGVEAPLLQELWMGGCIGITDVTTLLQGCRALTVLDLSGTSVDQSGIVGVGAPQLRQLWLKGCCRIVDIKALLRGCRQTLTVLDLRGTCVAQEGIAGVEAPSLEKLWIAHCRGIKDISTLLRGCRSLKTLDLRGSGVTQTGITDVAAPLLEQLWMTDCSGINDITDLLWKCKTLKVLELGGTGIVSRDNIWGPTTYLL